MDVDEFDRVLEQATFESRRADRRSALLLGAAIFCAAAALATLVTLGLLD